MRELAVLTRLFAASGGRWWCLLAPSLLCASLLEIPFAHAGPALFEAAASGDLTAVQLLIDEPAATRETGQFGQTPLYAASRRGASDIVKLLLEHGAKVDARSAAGLTPLHVAAARGHVDVVRLLLANCADVEAKDKMGRTPLHWAAARGHLRVAELLIRDGADLEAQRRAGLTPFRMATQYRQLEMAELLRAVGRFKAITEAALDADAPRDDGLDSVAQAANADAPENDAMLPESASEDTDSPAPVLLDRPLPPVGSGKAARETTRPRGTRGTRTYVQEKLLQLGYDPGPVDGQLGERTLDSILAFQEAIGQVAKGEITRCLLDRLTLEAEIKASASADSFVLEGGDSGAF